MSLANLLCRSAWEHQRALEKKEYSALELASACLKQAAKYADLGIFLRYDESLILTQAEGSDKRRAQKKTLSPLDGIPISIKDNIAQRGRPLSCASRILENYSSPYDATVIQKLRKAGAVLFGQTNMDEFAMGSSTENSAFQKTLNPWNKNCVPGGSSGGSAASVAACITPLSLGSDTGGSVRQPGSFCGVLGMRPSYGRVSRYGLAAFASSMDQIGPLSRTVQDSALLLSTISDLDFLDTTSHPLAEKDKLPKEITAFAPKDLAKLKIGLILPKSSAVQKDVGERVKKAAEYFTACKAQVVSLESKLEESVISIYYILATAEASSNLSRYDGVRYGKRAANPANLQELYIRSRTEGFGPEVRRRILLGTFVLSAGYYDAYYKKAQLAREMIQKEYAEFFKKADFLLCPTSPATAFRLGEHKNPLSMYRSDLFTIPSALAGLPCLSIPAGLDQQGLPIGIQFIAPPFFDERLLQLAAAFERDNPQFRLDYARFTSRKS